MSKRWEYRLNDVRCIDESQQARLFLIRDGRRTRRVWVPKAQVLEGSTPLLGEPDVTLPVVLVLPDWLVESMKLQGAASGKRER